MNFKKTTIATAVGSVLAVSGALAPSMAYADGHKVTLYGRVNTAINMVSVDDADAATRDEDSTNISTIGSRVGIKASAPIDDNTTAHARFEWSASTDDETGAFGDTRIGEVGVTGNFGTVKIGNMWSTYYNLVGSHLDPTVTLGAVLYSGGADLPYRVSNAIQYSNSFGAVTLSAEMRMSDADDPDEAPNAETEKVGESDGNAIGVSFMPMDQLTLAAVVDSQDGVGTAGDEDRTGFVAKWAQDNWWVSFGTGETDIDRVGTGTHTQFHAGMDFGNNLSGFIGIGSVELDEDGTTADPKDLEATTFNVTKRIAKSGFRVYYEGILAEQGNESYDQHVFGARMDF